MKTSISIVRTLHICRSIKRLIRAAIAISAAVVSGAVYSNSAVFGDCRTPSFTSTATFDAGTNPMLIAAGDLNGDGAIDVVVPNLTTDTFSILFGDGAGGFRPPITTNVGIKGGTVGAYPRAAASTKQHRQALHEKSTKCEFLIKPGAN